MVAPKAVNAALEAIHSSVALVLSELPAIGKNSNAPGSMGGYAFRSIEDITAALKPLLAKHGVVIVPSIVERRDSLRPIGNNRQMFVVDLLVAFTFYGEDGSSFVASMWGEGTDMGDKATQKAVTSAFKSMLTVTFCISDADSESFEVPVTVQDAEGAKSQGKSEGVGTTAPVAASSAGSAGGALSSPPAPDAAPAISKARREKLKSRCVALTADGVSVADAREELKLPLVDSCNEEETTRFEALVTDLEQQLEAPFAESKS